MNLEQMWKHIMQCLKSATCHTCAFNMAYVGEYKCNGTSFPSRLVKTNLLCFQIENIS